MKMEAEITRTEDPIQRDGFAISETETSVRVPRF